MPRTHAPTWASTRYSKDCNASSALINAPQEVWRLKLSASEELYLLGRFLRGKQRIDALAVFKREGGGEWREGKTAYAFDLEKGIERKRRELIENAKLRWVEV